jgi:peptide/nickel transport system substrate-binding protein
MSSTRLRRRSSFVDGAVLLVAVLAATCLPPAELGTSASAAQAPKKKKRSGKSRPAKTKKQPAGKKKPAGEEHFPKLSEMLEKLPTVAQLLKGDPVDWVVLAKNSDVLVTLPVSPRPETLKKIKDRVEKAEKERPRRTTKEEKAELESRLYKLRRLYITLKDAGGGNPERAVYYKDIKEVIHHEDLLLLRIGKLQDEGNLALAFELLFNLKRKKPGWPGIDEYEIRQLHTEARQLVKEHQWTTALVRLEELFDLAETIIRRYDTNADEKLSGEEVPTRLKEFLERLDRNKDGALTSHEIGLPEMELVGAVVDRLTEDALKTSGYRKARHYLGRLQRRFPTHAVYTKWRDDLQKRAAALLTKANTAAAASGHDEAERLVRQAVEIWPDTPDLPGAFDAITRRFQRLRVGVRRLAGERTPYFLPTLADERVRFLTQTPLFEAEAVADQVVHYQTRYFSDWLPTDLGRLTVFQLETNRPYWLPQPVVSAADVARNLQYRLDPNSPEYDERLTTYIHSVRVDSPTKLQIRFSRVPPRFESILRFPLRNTDEWRPGKSTGERVPSLLSPRFAPLRPSQPAAGRRLYRRARPEPDGVPGNQYHVAEVEERRFASDAPAIQALKRGEIDLLAHVHPFDKPRLEADSRVTVKEYALPLTHVLQFNPDSPATGNREFRRALAFALDRQGMLNYLILRTQDGGDPNFGRVVSAPFSSGSYAYNPTVERKKHDITLAMALAIAVRKQYERAHEAAVGVGAAAVVVGRGAKRGWIPRLKMLVAPGEGPRKVAEVCVRQWGRIGIKVDIVTAGKLERGKQPEWDIIYRTVKMADPVVELWPFLTLGDLARVADLKQVPDWLRQELIRIDLARDWTTAVSRMRSLHRRLAEQTQLIPLFEVDDFMAYRREVYTFRSDHVQPVTTYHDVERWSVRRSYPPNFP